MNILFRADSSSTIGTGHIMRDLVLAKQYPNSNIFFATQDLEGNLNHKIIESGYEIVDLQSNDLNELIEVLKTYKIDKIVIDNYDIDYEFEKALKERIDIKLMVLDDTYEQHYCDVLLNHNIYAEETKYTELVPKDCTIYCGSKYTLLREEFKKIKKNKKTKNTLNVKNIFVAMGGSDIKNLNPLILEILENFNNIHVDMVTTYSNANLNFLIDKVSNKNWITLHINSSNLAELMSKSDLAIVTPSVTMNEVWYMQVPFIAIKVVKNQEIMYNYLKEQGFCVLNEFSHFLLEEKIKSKLKDIK